MSKKLFRRSLSALLSAVITMEFGITNIPQDVFAIDTDSSFAVYSDSDIVINTNKSVINGNVYSGNDFTYLGNDICYVNKTLNADKISDNVYALNKVDSRVVRPDYTELLRSRVSYGKNYQSDTVLRDAEISLDGSIYVNGDLTIDRTLFTGRGYVNANGNIKYSAVQNDEETEMFLTSSNGNIIVQGSDIVMTGVIYAPEGTVEINAKNFTLNGEIVAKNIELNGTNLIINELSEEDNILTQFRPEVNFKEFKDSYKENRKITLDISDSFGLSDINTDSLKWDFSAEDTGNYGCIKVDDTASSPLHRELIITKAGDYSLRLSGEDNNGVPFRYIEKITITEDIAPIADFWKELDVVGRDENGVAEITLEDTSYSLDGDEIGSRVWSVFFDSDNDGDFSDEEEEIFSAGNETKVTYTAKSVGKYKFNLHVAEVYTDTIRSLLTDDSYRVADTNNSEKNNNVIEVTNEAPESYSGISKAKNVDIVITAGNVDIDDINTLNSNIEEVKQELESKGFSVNLTALSTSTLTAKDTFAWKEYDHYNYRDTHLPTLDKHIIYNDNSIQMVGYGVAPLRDWLFVDDGIEAKRILSFDMVRDRTDWHSMEGGGFLFNTTIMEEIYESEDPEKEPVAAEKMNGYCILLTSGGFKLIKLSDVDVETFRNGGISNSVQSIGQVLTSVRVPDVYADYSVRIIANSRLVSVYINNEKIIDNFVLPDTSTGTGFGPIICHDSHGCSQQSYFTFSNIRMSTVHGSEFSDVLEEQKWRESSERFVINLSQESLYDLHDAAAVGYAVKSLAENNAHFIGLGTVDSKDEYNSILSSTDGVYLDWFDVIRDKEILKKYVLNVLDSNDYTVGEMITTSDEIVYDNYYVDKENDPIGEQVWTYDLDASIYENSSGKSGVSTSDVPMTTLSATGIYKITSRLRDDPTNNNPSLEDYKMWSNEVKWTDGLYVHSKPVAEISSEVFKTDEANKYICELSFDAYDNDALSKENKGIIEEKKEWKRINDSEWMEGTVPKTIDAEEVYLQKYIVRDEQGEWSDVAIELIYAEKQENTDLFTDDEAPVIKLTVSDEKPCFGDQIVITATATDNTEVAFIQLLIDGKVVCNYPGTVIYDCKKEGIVTVTVICEDIAHNRSTVTKEINVEDRRDLVPPEITIDTKNDIIFDGSKIDIKGTIKDDVKFSMYTVEVKASDESEFSEILISDEEVFYSNIVSFDTNGKTGKFSIRITASDAAGNTSCSTLDITVSKDEGYEAEQNTTENTAVPEERTDTPAEISIDVSTDTAEVGETVNVIIDASDVDGLTSVKIYKDDKLVGEGTGELRFSETEAKTVTIKVETTDAAGNKTTKTKEIVIIDSADRTAPTAEIKTPESGSEISGKVSVVGSAYDETALRKYTIEYRKDGETSYKLIASSLNERYDAELAVWDTYSLDNAVYELRLTVIDNGGNSTIVTVKYHVKNGAETVEDEVATELLVFSKPEPTVSVDDTIKVEAKADTSLAGNEYEVSIKRADGTGAQTIIKSGTVDKSGNITASADSSMFDDGRYIVTIAVKVTDGDSVRKEVSVNVRHDYKKADEDIICEITSPEDNTEISAPEKFKASLTKNIFSKYKFEYAPVGTKDFTVFDKGTVSGGEITGKLDTTLMENGLYDIRLTA